MRGYSKVCNLLTVFVAIALSLSMAPATARAADDSSADKAALTTATVQQSSNSYKVAFKANGGKGAMKAQTVKRGKKTALAANEFTRAGYKFAGWNTKKNGTGKSYKNKAKVKNLAKAGKTVKLYAQWKKAKDPAYKTVSTASMMNSAVFNGKRYQLESYSYYGSTAYRITESKGGSAKTLATDVKYRFITNGHYMFYSKNLRSKQYVKDIGTSLDKYALYQLDLVTGKSVRLATGPELTPFDCSGSVLYYGPYKSLYGADLYAMNLKTKKKTLMVSGVRDATYSNGYVITAPHHNVGINLPVYSFKANGKGKKKIATAMEVRVIKKRVYYIVIDNSGKHPYPNSYRKYSCTLRGKGKKAMTSWDTFQNVSFSHNLTQP